MVRLGSGLQLIQVAGTPSHGPDGPVREDGNDVGWDAQEEII